MFSSRPTPLDPRLPLNRQVIDKLYQQDLPPALRFVVADFFKPLPPALTEGGGLDAALFQLVLHNWDDKVRR